MGISEYIGIAGFLLALVSFVWNIVTQRKLNKLDVQLKEFEIAKNEKEEAEEKQADVEVNTVDTPKGQLSKLVFYNKGKSTAYNIRIAFPDDTTDEIQLQMTSDYLPYPKLLPQQSFEIRYWYQGRKDHQTVQMTWDDAFDKDRNKDMVIDM
jgi:hypothetical protein